MYKRQHHVKAFIAQLSAGVILVDFHEQPFEVCNPLLIPGTVSYTHLDVYKRQAQPRLEDLYLWLFPEEMEETK